MVMEMEMEGYRDSDRKRYNDNDGNREERGM
jgi:hypothetical protein